MTEDWINSLPCRALSLWQPWATLVALGAKRIETRRWRTSYRGPLVIHATRKLPPEAASLADEHDMYIQALDGRPSWSLPLGCLLATCILVDVIPTATLLRSTANRTPELDAKIRATLRFVGKSTAQCDEALTRATLTEQEFEFGDYREGRYAWLLDDIVRLPHPITCRGRQRLFDWRTSGGCSP